MAEDDIDLLVSTVTPVKNDSAGRKPDKISTEKPRSLSNGRRVFPKPDKIRSEKPRSLSNGRGVLPCYRTPSVHSSYDGGSSRRKFDSPDRGQDILPHYLRASTGSCHDSCKYGGEHSFETKSRFPLPKRKSKLPADEQSPTWTMVGEAKKVTQVKPRPSTTPGILPGEGKKVIIVEHKPSTTPKSMLQEGKKVSMVEDEPSTSPWSMLQEGKKVSMVENEPSSTPGSMLQEGKKVSMVEDEPSTTPGSMLQEGKKVSMVENEPSSTPGSMLQDGKKVSIVEHNPSSTSGSMLREGKKVTVVNKKSSAPPGSMLGKGKVTVVNQKLSTPPESTMVEKKKVTVVNKKSSANPRSIQGEGKVTGVNQKPSAPPGSTMGEGKKMIVVNQKLSGSPGSISADGKKGSVFNQKSFTKVHSEPSEIMKKKPLLPPKNVDKSLKGDSSSDKIPIDKKMKDALAKHPPRGQIKLKIVNQSSSFKSPGGVDRGDRINSDVNSTKRIVVSKAYAEKSLNPPTVSYSPKSSFVKPLILRPKSNKSLKLLAPLRDKRKLRRDDTIKLNPEKVPEKTLHVIMVETEKDLLDSAKDGSILPSHSPPSISSPKSSSQSLSSSSSYEEEKEAIECADSEADESTSTSKVSHTAEAETVGKNQKKTSTMGRAGVSEDPSAVKLKFRRGKVVDLQHENNSPRKLKFRQGRLLGENQDSKGDVRRRIYKKKVVIGDKSSTLLNSGKVVLRHQDVQAKKDAQGLLNNVIEETASKLVESKKSKVKALVGAFETVISLQESKPSTLTV